MRRDEELDLMFSKKLQLGDPKLPPSFRDAELHIRTKKTKKRDSVMGSLLRFKEASARPNENKLSDKHLGIVWEEKTIDVMPL
jgi:hypothetical protein